MSYETNKKNNLEQLKEQLNERKSSLLKTYSEMILTFEENRQLYEKALDSMTLTDSSQSVYCTKVIACNNSWTVAQFALIAEDGTMLYKGEHLSKGESDYIDLSTLNIPYESKYKVKAIVDAGSDSTASTLILYRKGYSNAYCFLTGTTFNTTLVVTY